MDAARTRFLYTCFEADTILTIGPDVEASCAQLTLKCDLNQRFQTIVGFGASLTHASAAVLSTHLQREEILDKLFCQYKLSCLRVCIGASDFANDPAFTCQDDPLIFTLNMIDMCCGC